MDAWESLVDCPSKDQFDDCLKKFEIVCLPWLMFIDYVNQTWIISHKEKFVKALTNKVMHLENTTRPATFPVTASRNTIAIATRQPMATYNTAHTALSGCGQSGPVPSGAEPARLAGLSRAITRPST